MIGLAIVGLAIADRFLLKRNKVTIYHTRMIDDPFKVRFVLGYGAKRKIHQGKLTYSLRSKKRPSTIVQGERKIGFSGSNDCSEYIVFDREELELEAGESIAGEWLLEVEIERSCSFINPLYKIFPSVTTHTEEFELS